MVTDACMVQTFAKGEGVSVMGTRGRDQKCNSKFITVFCGGSLCAAIAIPKKSFHKNTVNIVNNFTTKQKQNTSRKQVEML